MRMILLCCCLVAFSILNAQTFVPGSFADYRLANNLLGGRNDSALTKKWSLNKFSGISTSFIGWKGGHATMVSAPIGLQLNRRISNNVFAFAGLSVAPSYINFHQAFITTDINKSFPNNSFFTRTNTFSLYPRAEVGLSYTNDERTFSISGSIGVERTPSRMPVFVPAYNNVTTGKFPQ